MKEIKIVEIGPRDGFQNVQDFIPTAVKIEIIQGLIDSGLAAVQLTSFVNPKAVPQMQDASEITGYFLNKYPKNEFSALTANLRGAKDAWNAGLQNISFVISVSASHNLANVNKTPEESLEELSKIREEIPMANITLDVATAFGCPFEGMISIQKTLHFIESARKRGISHFNICDTIGIADPVGVRTLCKSLLREFPQGEYQIHIHDTRNMGIANTLAAVESGISTVQSSIGGLGGCPFAPGASGNTSTEDLVYMLERMGYHTGVSFPKVLETAKFVLRNIDGNYSGHQIFINKEACENE